MSLPLKNRPCRRLILWVCPAAILMVLAVFWTRGSVWSNWDHRILDRFYQEAVDRGKGPPVSRIPRVVYVTITDETYAAMGTNYLDRSFLARVNRVLADLGVQSVAYDLIFAQPARERQDADFAASLGAGPAVFLPLGLRLAPVPVPFEGKAGPAYEKLESTYTGLPDTRGKGQPYTASSALCQAGRFAGATDFSGHISSLPDPDGVTRRLPLLVKIGDRFLPALSLSVFLEAVGVSFDDIRVDWGKILTIPAAEGSFLDAPVKVPMDSRGRVFIPFVQTWEKGFEEVPAQRLLAMAEDETLSGSLADIFEGNIVFVGDISTGISDLGNIPVQDNVPLVMVHAAMVNGLFTRTFYRPLTLELTVLAVAVMGLFTGLAALFRPVWPLYLSVPFMALVLGALTWMGMGSHLFVPAATLLLAQAFMAGILILTTELFLSRERSRIRGMFTRYVPQKIVTHLLDNPERVKMGGEIREITILMSDLRGFTALSAARTPDAVIHILNRYLEEMVDIIMDHGGVIDEIIGDGILAFFGAPEPLPDHPARAVACALSMQQAMAGINSRNEQDGLPRLEMGIGINTGEVIVGNIGSERRTKYGAVGSQVNFTGRVESYTTGGQVLITRATRDRVKSLIRVGETMDVEMKGMAEPVRLYSVTGMDGGVDISLEPGEAAPAAVRSPLEILIRRVEGKVVGEQKTLGKLTHLSRTCAVVTSPAPFAPLENIIFYLSGFEAAAGSGVYAKVTAAEKPGTQYRLSIRFTSVPPEVAGVFALALEDRPTLPEKEVLAFFREK